MKDSASTRFKKRLRELREQRGWTQEKAAEECGVGYKLYQLYELGIKKNPGLLTLERIAAGYELDVSELLVSSLSKTKRFTRRTRHFMAGRRGKPQNKQAN